MLSAKTVTPKIFKLSQAAQFTEHHMSHSSAEFISGDKRVR